MISISVKSDLDAMAASMTDMQRRQIPFAAKSALNTTAKKVVEREQHEIRDVFNRPTPYTQSAVKIFKWAEKRDLQAIVGIKDDTSKGIPASKYLASEISGGGRRMKRFEKALQSVGALPEGYRAVPGAAAKLDAYGNMSPAQIVQILSFFKAFPEAGYKMNMTDKRRASLKRGTAARVGFEYFVGRPGDRLPLGVWQRFKLGHGGAIKPVLIFVPHAVYQAIFDFDYVARQTVEKEFAPEFDKAMADALRTAR